MGRLEKHRRQHVHLDDLQRAIVRGQEKRCPSICFGNSVDIDPGLQESLNAMDRVDEEQASRAYFDDICVSLHGCIVKRRHSFFFVDGIDTRPASQEFLCT